jgi:hypothetical protein
MKSAVVKLAKPVAEVLLVDEVEFVEDVVELLIADTTASLPAHDETGLVTSIDKIARRKFSQLRSNPRTRPDAARHSVNLRDSGGLRQMLDGRSGQWLAFGGSDFNIDLING